MNLTDEEVRKASLRAGMQEHYMDFHSGFIRFAAEVIRAHMDKLMEDAGKPYGYEFSEATYMKGDVRGRGWNSQCFSHYNPSNERGMVADIVPLYSEDQLAAARLQDQQRIADLEAQLAESGYSACDMATAAAQGFRDGMSQSK